MGVTVNHRYTGKAVGGVALTPVMVSIGTAVSSGSVTLPAPNLNLAVLNISLSDNATLGTAGVDILTIKLNGVTVFAEGIYLPSAPGSQAGAGYFRSFSETNLVFPAGNGALTWTLSAPLTAGVIYLLAYFTS